jgi:hypothetical protein
MFMYDRAGAGSDWTYPVSVDGIGLDNWLDGSPIQLASMTLSYIFPARAGCAVNSRIIHCADNGLLAAVPVIEVRTI